jgi:hypothetical protein
VSTRERYKMKKNLKVVDRLTLHNFDIRDILMSDISMKMLESLCCFFSIVHITDCIVPIRVQAARSLSKL